MHESLKVYLKDRFVGWLSHESTGDVFSFKYDETYLTDPSDGALSFALPIGNETFDSVRTYRFFANLLPPQVVRQRLGASLQDRKSTRLNSSHTDSSRMPSSA